MRAFRLCGCVLLTGTLLILGSCAETSTYPHKGAEVETSVVFITDCVATPDLVKVKNKTPIHWEVKDNATYIINFNGSLPIQGAVPVVSAALQDSVHTVRGGSGCSSLLPSLCGTHPYTLTQVMPNVSKLCQDPGVHVVP
jgi:hypothetical protein